MITSRKCDAYSIPFVSKVDNYEDMYAEESDRILQVAATSFEDAQAQNHPSLREFPSKSALHLYIFHSPFQQLAFPAWANEVPTQSLGFRGH